jgi:hypothetical protein
MIEKLFILGVLRNAALLRLPHDPCSRLISRYTERTSSVLGN